MKSLNMCVCVMNREKKTETKYNERRMFQILKEYFHVFHNEVDAFNTHSK